MARMMKQSSDDPELPAYKNFAGLVDKCWKFKDLNVEKLEEAELNTYLDAFIKDNVFIPLRVRIQLLKRYASLSLAKKNYGRFLQIMSPVGPPAEWDSKSPLLTTLGGDEQQMLSTFVSVVFSGHLDKAIRKGSVAAEDVLYFASCGLLHFEIEDLDYVELSAATTQCIQDSLFAWRALRAILDDAVHVNDQDSGEVAGDWADKAVFLKPWFSLLLQTVS